MRFCGILAGEKDPPIIRAEQNNLVRRKGAGVDKRNLNWFTWGFMILMVVVVALMLSGILRRDSGIVLPDTHSTQDTPEEDSETDGNALTVVEVVPETVQAAIATLARPEQYRRTVSVQQLWTGGSGTYEVAVTVSGGWTRTDRTMPDGRVRHTVTGAEESYIWYNNERKVYTAPTGTISADHEQSIPTYEEVLELPVEAITAADYRVISGVNCIYVETKEDASGYVRHYWVSVDSGLLVAAEQLLEEEPVYRMTALTLDQTAPSAGDFTLPDGRVLLET